MVAYFYLCPVKLLIKTVITSVAKSTPKIKVVYGANALITPVAFVPIELVKFSGSVNINF